MSRINTLPTYTKLSILVIGLYFLVSMLSIARPIFIPLLYAILISILLSPAVDFLVRRGLYRVFSITLVLSFTVSIGIGLLILFSFQINNLVEAWPEFVAKFEQLMDSTVHWTSTSLGIQEGKIVKWIRGSTVDLKGNSNSAIVATLVTMSSLIMAVTLTTVYTFLFLFYRPHLIHFIHLYFGSRNHGKVNEFLFETKKTIQSFLLGLIIEIAVVSVLNTAGLLILGIPYAVLLGVAGAFLNVIPYIGPTVAMAIYAFAALLTRSPQYALLVIGVFLIIQFIDNNILVPRIIGAKVKLNALVSILSVICGAALWGIPGMFLAIPTVAIIKLMFDRIESFKNWGFLLGHTVPVSEEKTI